MYLENSQSSNLNSDVKFPSNYYLNKFIILFDMSL